MITCKDLHFDLVQGYFIGKPVLDIEELCENYPHIANYNSKRNGNSIASLVETETTFIDPVRINDDMKSILEKFRQNHSFSFLPVVDDNSYPVGVINEEPLKKYLYHPYGYSLISNHSIGKLGNFIENIPVADIKTAEETLLSIFATSLFYQGIVITKELKYYGFLTLSSFIGILNEKKMHIARESNPLTKLPGNNLISDNIHSIIKNNPAGHILAYWDMDNFKPFNDKYGFRQGDRVILFFADLLKTSFENNAFKGNTFIGHIGGDDFFTSFDLSYISEEVVIKSIEKTVQLFSDSIASIHGSEDFRNGYYLSRDRKNHLRKIPLLSVSCAVIRIKPVTGGISFESVCSLISQTKKKAKKSESGIAFADVK